MSNNKTGFNELRMVQALTDCEWEAVRHFRQKYFFDRVRIDGPDGYESDPQDIEVGKILCGNLSVL